MEDLLHRNVASGNLTDLSTVADEITPTYTLQHSNGQTYIINTGSEYTVTKMLNDAKNNCSNSGTLSFEEGNIAKLSCYDIAKDKIAIQYGHLEVIEDIENSSNDTGDVNYSYGTGGPIGGFNEPVATTGNFQNISTKAYKFDISKLKEYLPYGVIAILIIYLIFKK